ncbi:PD-(D/E)XK nuclease family protein [Candidatus Pacearchaeota archaeon]|nr:PD-(D/E)XK nuclease family protein [Candidatus Pacearchaeota archaeon]
MAVYSHSRLNMFEQCPLRYKYRYIDKKKPDIEKTIEAHLGSIVHDVLELIYIEAKNNKVLTIDEIINYYSENWQKDYSEDILVVKDNKTVKDYFNLGVEFLVSYYNTHQPFKDGTMECEKRIWINLDEAGKYKLMGFIDRLVYNFETKEYEVHDYKTANSLPTQEKIDNDKQLALYSIAIKNLFGHDKEVVLIWHYLAHNKKIESRRTNEQLQQLKEETLKLIDEIEATKTFPHNKSPLCGWCQFKPSCEAWKSEIQRPLDIYGD